MSSISPTSVASRPAWRSTVWSARSTFAGDGRTLPRVSDCTASWSEVIGVYSSCEATETKSLTRIASCASW